MIFNIEQHADHWTEARPAKGQYWRHFPESGFVDTVPVDQPEAASSCSEYCAPEGEWISRLSPRTGALVCLLSAAIVLGIAALAVLR